MAQRRTPKAPKAIEAETFADHFGTISNDRRVNTSEDKTPFLNTFLYAPYDRKQTYPGTIAMSLLMELIGTLVFVLFSNLARLAANGTSVLLDGAVLGLVMGGTYYMATGWRLHLDQEQNELPRHLSWSVSFGYFLVLRTGLVIMLAYLFVQTLGSLIAGGILYGIGAGVVPAPLIANLHITWGFEILGSAIIVFTLLYNHLLGGTYADEDVNQRPAQELASFARALFVTVAYQFQVYSLDAVVYLGGLIGLCTGSGCPDALPFHNAPVFYLLVPLLGAVIAAIVYVLLLCVYGSKRAGYAPAGNQLRKAGSKGTPALTEEPIERSSVRGHTQVDDLVSAKRL